MTIKKNMFNKKFSVGSIMPSNPLIKSNVLKKTNMTSKKVMMNKFSMPKLKSDMFSRNLVDEDGDEVVDMNEVNKVLEENNIRNQPEPIEQSGTVSLPEKEEVSRTRVKNQIEKYNVEDMKEDPITDVVPYGKKREYASRNVSEYVDITATPKKVETYDSSQDYVDVSQIKPTVETYKPKKKTDLDRYYGDKAKSQTEVETYKDDKKNKRMVISKLEYDKK